MSAARRLRYHFNVTLLGRPYLRLQRLRSARKLRRAASGGPQGAGPPLRSSPRLRELIGRHYLRGRHANDAGPVAWVTSGAPVEFLTALGYFLIWPENHGAVCGIRRQAEALASHAEDAGWSRDLCSYARTDIGSVLSGETPVGRLARPDLLLCCTNICQTVLYWYRVLAHHFRVPLILIDTPFLYDGSSEHAVAYVTKQLEAGIEVAERAAGRSLSLRRLQQLVRRAKQATELWAEVIGTARHRPAPLTAFDEFIHMAPIVAMRGEASTVDYYRDLLAELRARVEQGVGAVQGERKRLLWDNLPVWYRMRELAARLSERGVSLVASTYTNAWAELAPMMDPERPLDSAARVYLHPILNRGVGHKLGTIRKMIADYGTDGVILHSDRSCKPYSIGQMDQNEKIAREIGVPSLLLEADHNDPRAFSEAQVENRLAAFFEVLGL